MSPDLSKGFQLGPWKVDPPLGQISGPAGDDHLEPKVMDVLVALAERAGELVSREQLLARVWGERAVSDEPLTRAIGELRRALGDTPGSPTFIETVPKRGYRLLLPADGTAAIADVVPGRSAAHEQHGTQHRALKISVVVAIAMLVAVFLWNTNRAPVTLMPSEQVTVAVDAPGRPALAVLQFCDLSGGDQYAYFGQGLTDDLTTHLARSPELLVISNTSASQFACQPASLIDVGQELSARYLVTGSVRVTATNEMRITARLVDTLADRVVWGESYERQFSAGASLAVQADIAASIARSLAVQVMDVEARVVTEDATAWQLYAQGRHLVKQSTPEEVREGRSLLQRAIERDPTLAEASSYLGMTDLYRFMLSWDPDLEDLERGEKRIRQALALDPTNHVANTHLAWARMCRGETEEAIRLASRSIEMVPSYDTAYGALGWSLMKAGRVGEAGEAFRLGLALNPKAPLSSLWTWLGTVSYLQGDTPLAVELWERARSAMPGVGQGPILLAYHYQTNGRSAEAQAIVQEVLRVVPDATAMGGHHYMTYRLPEAMIPSDLIENLRAAGLP